VRGTPDPGDSFARRSTRKSLRRPNDPFRHLSPRAARFCFGDVAIAWSAKRDARLTTALAAAGVSAETPPLAIRAEERPE
jgi:hypothetical protein